MSESTDRQPYFVAGAIAIILGLGYFVFIHDSGGRDTGCALSAAGVSTLAFELSRGHSAAAALAAVGGAAVANDVCKRAVSKLLDNESATFDISTPSGNQVRTFQLPDLTGAVPQSTVARAIACRGWTSPILFKMCLDGYLNPI